jgi:cytidyltransferase-like protein
MGQSQSRPKAQTETKKETKTDTQPVQQESQIPETKPEIKPEAQEKIVCVSGYFDPIHIGHIEYFKKSKEIGTKLMVIVNNDDQARLKKGRPFMPCKERMQLIEELKCVDIVVESIDTDRTVCNTLSTVEPKPDFFCNGGDQNNNTIPEGPVCEARNIELRDGFGEKIQSSSWLIGNSHSPVQEEVNQEEEPVEETKTEEPVEETKTEEPVEEVKTEEPVEEVKTEEPVEEVKTEEPVEEVKTEEPVEEVKTEEPIEETKIEEPQAEEPVEEGKEEVKEEPQAEEPVEEVKEEEPQEQEP